MIHEFAVDPDALAGWQNFRYLVEKFGVANGRLISRFPKEWKRMVYQACEACPDIEKKRIVVALEQIDEKLLAAGRSYDRTKEWIPNALRSHDEEPFQGIITVAEKITQGGLLDAATLSDSNPKWKAQRGKVIPRTPVEIASAASRLLFCSSHVVFVDQHFSGVARFGKPLKHLIRCACAGNQPRRLEYHLGAKTITPEFFRGDIEGQRPHLDLPENVKLVFVRWKELFGGDQHHPRYVLTERGGIRVDVGLDEGDPGSTTDVECMDDGIYSHRWGQFQPDATDFEFSDAWIVTSEKISRAVWNGREFVEAAD